MQLFEEVQDGLILCKLINDSVPDTIDIRVLNKPTSRKPLNSFQMTENTILVRKPSGALLLISDHLILRRAGNI
jgi:hypothetical protein